ncbi:MAG: histidine ammonia-lyase [Acidobacteria bacterium]|nr:MAG: histidine ammonia-lyase [Acidobacteriota bacterium]
MIQVDGKSLTLEDFRRVVHHEQSCALAATARERIVTAHQVILDTLARGEAIYGVNTGFGDLAKIRIPDDQLSTLQERLLVSHAAGVGEPLPDEAVRGMLLLRANTLARGHSGVRPELVELLLAMLEADLLPVVPAKGSVGASGDLAPLSHLALPLIGRGEVRLKGEVLPAAKALSSCGLQSLELGPKEGLALINGTQAMTSLLALAALAALDLVRIADLVGAMSTDAVRGTDEPFDRRLHELRPHPGQMASAANLWQLLQGSEIRESHREGDSRVQDPYSIRCIPQVHGAARDLLSDIEGKLAIEMNAVTDNPLVFADDGEILSGGNFHGEPMAMAADILALALAELGSISERRIDKLTDSVFSGLSAFLTEEPGLNSGFMMAQVTAAALASENKGLTHPASVDSIPTSAEKEDHVSMGMGAAVKLQQVVVNTRQILAIELLSAAQGIDLLRPLKSSEPLEALHAAIRRRVPKWEEDREMAPDLATAAEFLGSDIRSHIEGLQ